MSNIIHLSLSLVELDLKGFFSRVSVGKSSVQLGDEIVVVTKLDLEGGDLSLEHLDLNLKLTDEGVEAVDLGLVLGTLGLKLSSKFVDLSMHVLTHGLLFGEEGLNSSVMIGIGLVQVGGMSL